MGKLIVLRVAIAVYPPFPYIPYIPYTLYI